MFKRLITAVFAVGLTWALAGSAISGPNDDFEKKVIVRTNTGNSSEMLVPKAYQTVPGAQKEANLFPAPAFVNPKPGPNSPDTIACYEQDYTDYANLCCYFQRLGGNLHQMAMRFDISAGHTATVNGSWVYLGKLDGLGATVGVTMRVWSDAGGIPNTLLYSETYLLPKDPGLTAAGGDYFYFPFTTPPVISDATYHISFGPNLAGPSTDFLWILADDGLASTFERGRSSMRTTAGVWLTTLANIAEDDNFVIISDQCEAYSQCVYNAQAMNFVGGFTLPRVGAPFFDGFGQRFVAEGPETIKVTHFWHGSAPLFGQAPHTVYPVGGTNGIEMSIWGDSAGHIDQSAGPLGTVTLPGGLLNMYPATHDSVAGFEDLTADFSSQNIVVLGGYHVVARTTSQVGATGSFRFFLDRANVPAADPVFDGASAAYFPPTVGASPTFIKIPLAPWGFAPAGRTRAALIEVETCRDEFADCNTEVLYGPAAANDVFYISSQRVAQLVTGLPVNRLDKLRFQIADETLFGGNPGDNGSPVVEMTIHTNSGGLPGALLYTQSVPSPVYYPGWNEVVIPGGYQIVGDFFVGYHNTANPATNYIYQMANLEAEVNGGAKYYSNGLAIWRDLGVVTGDPYNWIMEADFCSIPVDERLCAPDANWATRNHDYQRNGASGSALGDAYCDLTLSWFYEHPTQFMGQNGPIIYNGRVICAFTNTYIILDLVTGAVLDEINSADHALSLGGNIQCTPTVAVVEDTLGVPQTYLFLAGGNTNALSAWDIDVLPATRVWSIGGGNPATVPPHGAIGLMRFAVVTVLEQAGADIVYFTDETKVFAANADDGKPYVAFNGGGVNYTPFVLGGTPLVSGSTDGTRLFYSTFNNGLAGDIVAVNAVNGTLAWRLSVATGLKGASIFNTSSITIVENFEGGPMVDLALGAVYANSRIQAGAFPADGVFYNLKAADGSELVPAVASHRLGQAHGLVDVNRVMMPSLDRWSLSGGGTPLGGMVLAFGKNNNGLNWATESFPNSSSDNRIGSEGVLTCEPSGAPDYAIYGNRGGYIGFFNADDGNEVFNRRYEYGLSSRQILRSGAIGTDGVGDVHLVWGANFGSLANLTKQSDRARLEILLSSGVIAVPFGSPADTVITFEGMYTNTGCTPLIVSLTANIASNGTIPLTPGNGGNITSVRSSVAGNAASLANRLTANNWKYLPGVEEVAGDENVNTFATRDNVERSDRNRAALATPAFLNENGTYPGDVFVPAGGGIVLAPGDTAGISVHANGPLVNRGPNNFFVEFTLHNDPDYFLNTTLKVPQVFLTLVGGCLLDSTILNFGVGGANTQIVWGAGRVAESGHGWNIGGDGGSVYQGAYVYGVSKHRLATSCGDWTGAGPEADWISMQPDPNYCDGDCKPALSTNISLGSITADGFTYTPILGNMICKSYIDSVQNFTVGANWQWEYTANNSASAPFDNDSTMGLGANTRTIGALNVTTATGTLLNNGTIEIMNFTNRNATPINGWKMWSMMDYDIGTDTTIYRPEISTGWSAKANAAGPVGWGMVKIPFGCGYTPMKNAYALDATQAQFTDAIYWDSAYGYASLPPGNYGQNVSTAPQDQEGQWTFAENDFAGNGTLSLAIVNFRLAGLVDARLASNYGAIANLFNKFAGFGRGDVNNDNAINLADVIYLAESANGFPGQPGPIPFAHLGDVNASGGAANVADVAYLIDYYFGYGPCPSGAFVF